MNRRNFVKGIIASLGAIALPASAIIDEPIVKKEKFKLSPRVSIVEIDITVWPPTIEYNTELDDIEYFRKKVQRVFQMTGVDIVENPVYKDARIII